MTTGSKTSSQSPTTTTTTTASSSSSSLASATTLPTSNTVHLFVLIHGLWGNPTHLAEMARTYREIRAHAESERGPNGETLHVLLPQTNQETATYDGIDWGGERVAEEVLAEVKRLEEMGKTVTRFSITGYSLGGLIGRYAVGVLSTKGFLKTVTPVNFITIATPHLGQILDVTFRARLLAFLGPRLLSRTGEQLYSKDNWASSSKPLLEILADPGRIFFQALTTFSRVRFYANVVNDITVPYMTAAVETSDPFFGHAFNGVKIKINEKYSPMISSYEVPPVFGLPPPQPRMFSPGWFTGLHRRLILPPRLHFKFPGNILLLFTIPVLLPTMIGGLIVWMSLDARRSRVRIKSLERDGSYTERLVHNFSQLEESIEHAAIDYMSDPANSSDSLPAAQVFLNSAPSDPTAATSTTVDSSPSSVSPLLTASQIKIAKSLNSLPNLKKELAFIDPAVNSHAVIVVRDPKQFKHHVVGEGVLRHLADHVVI